MQHLRGGRRIDGFQRRHALPWNRQVPVAVNVPVQVRPQLGLPQHPCSHGQQIMQLVPGRAPPAFRKPERVVVREQHFRIARKGRQVPFRCRNNCFRNRATGAPPVIRVGAVPAQQMPALA